MSRAVIDFPHFNDQALEHFAPIAQRLCELIAAPPSCDEITFLRAVHGLLAKAYAAGLDLPPTGVLFGDAGADTNEEVPEPPLESDADRVTGEESSGLRTRLETFLGARCMYREVFDAYSSDADEEVTGSLADDFADIYADLMPGVRKWQRGETGEALWAWRFGLECHWGEHATSAIRALYALAAWHSLGWPTDAPPKKTPNRTWKPR
jgi:hypothetical protein